MKNVYEAILRMNELEKKMGNWNNEEQEEVIKLMNFVNEKLGLNMNLERIEKTSEKELTIEDFLKTVEESEEIFRKAMEERTKFAEELKRNAEFLRSKM